MAQITTAFAQHCHQPVARSDPDTNRNNSNSCVVAVDDSAGGFCHLLCVAGEYANKMTKEYPRVRVIKASHRHVTAASLPRHSRVTPASTSLR